MIDLHSHVLPAVDDGAPDDAAALAICRAAAADGVSVIVATPHYANGLGVSAAAQVAPAAARLQSLLDAESIPIQIRHAVEMPLFDDLLSLYSSGEWLAYDSARSYVLFEMPDLPSRGLDILARSVSTLHVYGMTPVLAHPERLHFLDDIDDAWRIRRLGARFQITAGALFSDNSAGRRARLWIEDGLVSCIATDSHGVDRRPPLLSPARDWVAQRFGLPAALALVRDNPRMILDGVPLP